MADDELANLLLKIAARDHGVEVAIDILCMRFHRSDKEPEKYSRSLIAASQHVLSMLNLQVRLEHRGGVDDYNISRVIGVCFRGTDGQPAAFVFCQRLKASLDQCHAYVTDFAETLKALAHLQPAAFLDVFFGEDEDERVGARRAFQNDLEGLVNPLDQISGENVLLWCEQDPGQRYARMTGSIRTFVSAGDEKKLTLNPLIILFLERAPDVAAVLERLWDAYHPRAWSGSLANLLQLRAGTVPALFDYANSEIAAWARSKHTYLQEAIRAERIREDESHRERNERFE